MDRTENTIMWDCLEDIFYRKAEHAQNVKKFITLYYAYNGKEVEYNFSHDNWTLVMCWKQFFGVLKDDFPIFGKHSRHPMRFIQYLWMKYKICRPLLLLTYLTMYVENTILKRRTASGERHTSGILLDYYVCYSFKLNWMMKVLTRLVEKEPEWKTWDKVFEIYHGNNSGDNYRVLIAFRNKVTR